MKEPNHNQANPLTDTNFTGISLRQPKKKAGGIPAVLSLLQHGWKEMGMMKTIKTLFKLNQVDGFDCPGCAWPDPDPEDRSSIGEYCENGGKAVAEEATKKQIGTAFFRKHSVVELSQWSDFSLGKSGRIIEPMMLKEGATHYEPISWEGAFSAIASQLQQLSTPDEAIFYTSGRTSNEAAYVYQLFVREWGTNNLPDCSNMCHESSGAALSETVGIGKGSVTLQDFYQTELILIIGQNPGTNHPRMLSVLEKAKKKGAKIISINPLREAGLHTFVDPQNPAAILSGGTPLTDLYLQVRINQDVALFKAILKLLWEAEQKNPGNVFDLPFIEKETAGYEDLLSDLAGYELSELIAQSGVPEADIRQAADLVIRSNKIIACWAMGLTQHKNAVDAIREVVNVLLLKGSVGIEGGGTCPVRGHSNVQGDRTVGICEKIPAHLKKSIPKRFGFVPPEKEGWDVVNSIKAMHEGKARFFMGLGGNFISATPDTLYTSEALQRCDMTVHVSTKLNRSHLIHGKTALILPCIARSEKDIHDGLEQIVSVENSIGLVHTSRGMNTPISARLLSETQIVCRLAQAALPMSTVNYDEMEKNYDVIRDHIEATIPGFEHYNERVRQTGGFYLPNGAREGRWKTTNGKANFTINHQTNHGLVEGELLMMTIRSHDQFNTTIYGLHDRYRGIYQERRVILMNPSDMKLRNLQTGFVIDIVSHFEGIERRAPRFIVIAYDIPPSCVATYFPEANVLVPINSVAHTSNTPTSKSIKVTVELIDQRESIQ